MNFTEESVRAAEAALDRLKKTYRRLVSLDAPQNSDALLRERMEEALDDDVNTAVALSELLMYEGNSAHEFEYWAGTLGLMPSDAWLEEPKRELPADFVQRLQEALQIQLNGETAEGAIAKVIDLRAQARASKNWAESDRLRDILAQCGVALKDSKEGTTWSVVD
jgi:cysteinyl-tRNA synthetase